MPAPAMLQRTASRLGMGARVRPAAPCARPAPSSRRCIVVASTREEAVKQLDAYTAEMRGTLTSDNIVPVDTTAPPAPEAPKADTGLLELNQGNFYEYLGSQGDTLVVVDFFTDWCGPCKLIYPELVKLAAANPDIRIVKFNCNKANKELGQKLAIKVAPTFHLYRSSTKVAEMTGAKVDKLVELINTHRK